jgi:hypothetical protein
MKNLNSKYEIKIYQASPKNLSRFVLGSGGKRPLFVIGLNPSTADELKPDRTISKVIEYARKNRFDGFIMLNLYPQRTTDPKELHESLKEKRHNSNVMAISIIIREYRNISIVAAWGNNIESRPYLGEMFGRHI